MEREELVAVVRAIMEGSGRDQEQTDALVDRFCAAVPHPAADELIFYPDKHFGREPTPEEVVARALAYRPIELGPAD